MTIEERILKLVKLSERQGHVTYGDINSAFPDSAFTAEDLDEVYIKLRKFDIEVLEHAANRNFKSRV